MITTTIKLAKKNSQDKLFKYSLQNLTTKTEYLSDNLKDLISFIANNHSNDDFICWDNEENHEVTPN